MKKLIFTAIIVALAATAYAFPQIIASESKTKGTTTVDTTYIDKLMFKTSAAATVTVNGAGTGWPTVANTDYTWTITPTVKSIVFSRTSSATPTVVYTAR